MICQAPNYESIMKGYLNKFTFPLDLLQVMIYIFGEYGRNLPTQIIRQVKILNYETIQI